MSPYPPHSDLAAWISPRYWDAYQSGTLYSDYVARDPFPHCVLPEFFRPDVFDRLSADCEDQLDTRSDEGGESVNQIFLLVPDVVRLLYGPELRRFFDALTGRRLTRPAEDAAAATAMPQLRRYVRGSSGLSIHTDDDLGFDLGMLIYLASAWRPGLGGEACLFRRVGGLLLEQKVVPPHANTLVLLFFSDESWHCVREMSPEWTRSNIFLGWQTTSPAGCREEVSLAECGMAQAAG